MQKSLLIFERGTRWKAAGFLLAVGLLAHAPMALSQAVSPSASGSNAMNSEESHPAASSSTGTVAPVRPHHSVKQLTEELKNQDPGVRAAAVEALGESHDAGALKSLIGELHDQDPYVRAIADTVLIKIGSPAVPSLIVALKDTDPYVPALAALALSTMKDPQSHDALMKVLQEHNARAIFGIHTYYVKLGVPGSEPALIEALNKYPSREMAEEFLNSGNPALQKAAEEWAIHYNRTLRSASTSASVRWGSAEDVPQPTANPATGAQ